MQQFPKSTVRIQFIGKHAEEWASSLLFWDEQKRCSDCSYEYDSQACFGEGYIHRSVSNKDGLQW